MAIKLKTDKLVHGENTVIYSTIIPEKDLGCINGKGWVRFYDHADSSQVTCGYADIHEVLYMRYSDLTPGYTVFSHNIGYITDEHQIVTVVIFTPELDEAVNPKG